MDGERDDASGNQPGGEPGSLASRREMGVLAVGRALKKARGRMSQRAAAERWQVPIATLAALEQGVVRTYQPQTLAQFDEMLGRSAYDLYEEPDADDGPSVADMRRAQDDMMGRLEHLSSKVDAFAALERRPSMDEEIASLWVTTPEPVRAAIVDLLRALRNGQSHRPVS